MDTPEIPPDAGAAEKPSAKGPIVKWVLISIGLFVLATLSQGLAPLITEPMKASLAARAAAKSAHAEEEAAEGEATEDAEPAEKLPEPFYQPLNPPMVVNFANDPSGFMQVAVQIMARSKEAIEVVKANEPAVRNALIMLYAGKTREDVLSREGKEKLRAETLAEVQNVLAPYAGEATIEDVYFTSIIAQ